MEKLLLITPPFVQPNTPYPATAYLKGYLTRQGAEVEQVDLSIELLNRIFCLDFLGRVFDAYPAYRATLERPDDNLEHIYALAPHYLDTIESVMHFLRCGDTTLGTLIVSGDFLPQGKRFDATEELAYFFGSLGTTDCARFLCTLYLQDLSDLIRAVISPHFEIVRYGERLSLSIPTFDRLEQELSHPRNLIEEEMIQLLEAHLTAFQPSLVGFAIPFPGNLLSALRCAQYIREQHPTLRTIFGGGYPSTELRQMTDPGLFRYVDYLILDDGEGPLERILKGETLLHTYTAEGYHAGVESITHEQRGCPDYSGLLHDRYFSLSEVPNPMHRLWSDGRWNKMMIAHGCYWARCAFCDTSLDYIGRYESVPARQFVDWMEQVMAQTGSRGFHFVDEAAPPKLLKEISLEILRRKLKVSWWTNIRFESHFTGDLTQLMAAAGCIAVSGGMETASDRLLKLMNKGVTIEQAALAMRNFRDAGIMVHTYLMYGFPTETLQESIDALEVVRQMFHAELIDSAFWHRYAMTVHSPSGREPERFGVTRKHPGYHPFANNEIAFSGKWGYDVDRVGDALREALANYLVGNGLNRPVHKWFAGKEAKPTTVEDTLITDQLIKPDAARLYHEKARVVWIGLPPQRTEQGIVLHSHSGRKALSFSAAETDFLMEILTRTADLDRIITLEEIKTLYARYSDEPFLVFYHAKKWDILRTYGLLQI